MSLSQTDPFQVPLLDGGFPHDRIESLLAAATLPDLRSLVGTLHPRSVAMARAIELAREKSPLWTEFLDSYDVALPELADVFDATIDHIRAFIKTGGLTDPSESQQDGPSRRVSARFVVENFDVIAEEIRTASPRTSSRPATKQPDPRLRSVTGEFLKIPTRDLTPGEFAPDPFQNEAREALQAGHDVLISAPTGSGKTWCATAFMPEVLARGGRVWYTTPLKALSNQKYDDFREQFGSESVGLLTGDRHEQGSARILVATTEILFNQLCDTFEPNQARASAPSGDLYVLDEAHWLGDPDRGCVWESIVILAPPGAQILLLSASIGNATELADWVQAVRHRQVVTVRSETRPVPLRIGVVRPDRVLPVSVAESEASKSRRPRFSIEAPQFAEQVGSVLRKHDLMPALIFLPTRQICDFVAGQARAAGFVAEAHHAGLPLTDRLDVESRLRDGLLQLVCCTTTLASGLDIPARSVVVTSLADGRGETLAVNAVQQMVGRAGRRGRDSVGFALLWDGEGADYRQWRQTLSRSPDSLNSAFHLRYDVLLGLLRRLSGDQVAAMVDRSFASFQRADAIAATRRETDSLDEEVQALDPNRRLDGQPCADRDIERDAYVTWKEGIGRPRDKGKKGAGQSSAVNGGIEPLCLQCPATKECGASFRKLNAARNRLIASESKNITLDPAREARRRIQVLGDWGALTADGRLTAKGELAARIRFPNGLLLLDSLPWLQRCSPVELAGGLASFVVQRTTRVREGVKLPDLKRAVDRFETIEKRAGLSGETEIGRLAADFEPYTPTRTTDRRVTRPRSFESTAPSEAERRAWLVSRFATGVRWSTLVRTGIADGDLERLVFQTVDLLRDVRHLPGMEDVARQAIELLARPPIFGSEARPLSGQ